MTAPKTISIAMLKKAGACDPFVNKYEPLFGPRREIPMTQTLARVIAIAFGRADWVADNIMTPHARTAYYERVRRIDQSKDYYTKARDKAEALYETYVPRKYVR